MIYAKIMIQAYAEACGITIDEAIKRRGLHNLVPADKINTAEPISDPRLQEILNDLRKDRKGVLAWAGETTT